jgi:hypothetical protein
MVEITRARYVSIGDLPLMTPAWHVLDMSEVYDGPSSRGADVVMPYMAGTLATRRSIGAARKVLPMVIFGDRDEDGNDHPDPRLGLIANLNTLKRALRIRQQSPTTTFRVEFEPEGLDDPLVLSAPCSVNWPLQVRAKPSTIRCLLDLTIPGGVLRDTVPVTRSLAGAGTYVVNNPGTAEQFAVQITLSGPATISNDTWGHTLTFSGTNAVLIDTAKGTATNAGNNRMGFVSWSGHENMFPLAVGENNITIPSGVTVDIVHYPAFA